MGFTITDLQLPIAFIPAEPMGDGALMRFCEENRDLRVERTSRGEIRVMSPTGSGTGAKNAYITYQLTGWALGVGGGVAFDSNAGFSLPDGSVLSPDASWVDSERWDSLGKEGQSGFAPICPQFVIELRSPTDRLGDLQLKMRQWIANGAQLAWLIDPVEENVSVYRPRGEVEVHQRPTSVQGDGVMAGFELVLARVWD